MTISPNELAGLSRYELEQLAVAQGQLLDARNVLLRAIPGCKAHGDECVPHAIEWVERMKWVERMAGAGACAPLEPPVPHVMTVEERARCCFYWSGLDKSLHSRGLDVVEQIIREAMMVAASEEREAVAHNYGYSGVVADAIRRGDRRVDGGTRADNAKCIPAVPPM